MGDGDIQSCVIATLLITLKTGGVIKINTSVFVDNKYRNNNVCQSVQV